MPVQCNAWFVSHFAYPSQYFSYPSYNLTFCCLQTDALFMVDHIVTFSIYDSTCKRGMDSFISLRHRGISELHFTLSQHNFVILSTLREEPLLIEEALPGMMMSRPFRDDVMTSLSPMS